MVKDDNQPSLNIREAYVFSVAILLRNDCEKLNTVNDSISLYRFKPCYSSLISSTHVYITSNNPLSTATSACSSVSTLLTPRGFPKESASPFNA